jgi:hypothetical protein
MASPFVFVFPGDPTAADTGSHEVADCIEAVEISRAAGGQARRGGEVGTGERLRAGHGAVVLAATGRG